MVVKLPPNNLFFLQKSRVFSPEELKPQPTIRKRSKVGWSLVICWLLVIGYLLVIGHRLEATTRTFHSNFGPIYFSLILLFERFKFSSAAFHKLFNFYILSLSQTFTPPEKKDDKYWEKRGKNNIAARRLSFAIFVCLFLF